MLKKDYERNSGLNPLWAFYFVGERIGSLALFGGSVVMLSIFFRAVMNHLRTGAAPAEG
jgi:hypothetical protein